MQTLYSLLFTTLHSSLLLHLVSTSSYSPLSTSFLTLRRDFSSSSHLVFHVWLHRKPDLLTLPFSLVSCVPYLFLLSFLSFLSFLGVGSSSPFLGWLLPLLSWCGIFLSFLWLASSSPYLGLLLLPAGLLLFCPSSPYLGLGSRCLLPADLTSTSFLPFLSLLGLASTSCWSTSLLPNLSLSSFLFFVLAFLLLFVSTVLLLVVLPEFDLHVDDRLDLLPLPVLSVAIPSVAYSLLSPYTFSNVPPQIPSLSLRYIHHLPLFFFLLFFEFVQTLVVSALILPIFLHFAYTFLPLPEPPLHYIPSPLPTYFFFASCFPSSFFLYLLFSPLLPLTFLLFFLVLHHIGFSHLLFFPLPLIHTYTDSPSPLLSLPLSLLFSEQFDHFDLDHIVLLLLSPLLSPFLHLPFFASIVLLLLLDDALLLGLYYFDLLVFFSLFALREVHLFFLPPSLPFYSSYAVGLDSHLFVAATFSFFFRSFRSPRLLDCSSFLSTSYLFSTLTTLDIASIVLLFDLIVVFSLLYN